MHNTPTANRELAITCSETNLRLLHGEPDTPRNRALIEGHERQIAKLKAELAADDQTQPKTGHIFDLFPDLNPDCVPLS